jgi:hypothetical protein
MSESRIVEHLIEEYDRSWKMLLQVIEKAPDEKWTAHVESIEMPWSETKGMNVWYFSDRVFHVIQTVEFYTSDNPEDMKWGGRIGGIDWKTESPDVTASRITKEDMLDYLSETKSNLEEKLNSFSEEDLFGTDGFKSYLACRFAKFVYTLRHSMWHIGELARAMREWDCERIIWR